MDDTQIPQGAIPVDQFESATPPPVATTPQHAVAAPTVADSHIPEGAIPVDQFESHEDKFGSTSEQVKTGLEGVAKGFLGPIATLGERALHISPDDIRAREEANPVTSGAGNFVGLGASLFTGQGLGGVALKAGNEAKAASGLLKAGEEAGILNKIGAEAIDQATQMAIIQGSDEVSKMILNDPNTSAESAMANVGLASALGGVTGAAIGAVSPLWKAAGLGDKAGKVVQEFKDEMNFIKENPNPITKATEELEGLHNDTQALKESLYSNGVKGDLIKEFLPEVTPQNQVKLETHLQTISDDLSKEISKIQKNLKISGQAKNLEQDLIDFQNKVKMQPVQPRAVESLVKDIPDTAFQQELMALPETPQGGFNPLQSPELTSYRQKIAMDEAGSKVLLNNARQAELPVVNNIDVAYSKPAKVDYTTAYNAVNDLKNTLQGYAKKGGVYGATTEATEFGNIAAKLGHDLRETLEDQKIWGKAGKVQETFNKAFSEFTNSKAEKDFLKTFTREVAGERVLDPAKINTFANQAGKPTAEIKNEILQNYIKEHEKFANRINKFMVENGKDPIVQPHSLNVINKLMETPTKGAQLAQALVKHLGDNVAGKVAGGGIGASIGGALGHPYWGAIAGEHLLSPMFAPVFHGLTQSLMTKAADGVAIKGAIDYGMSAAKAANTISKATGAVFKPGAQILATKIIPSEKDRTKLDKIVDDMQQNPTKITQIDNGKLGHYLDQHQTALTQSTITAGAYLAQIKPKAFRASPLDKEIPPTQAQVQRYNRALDIAHSPAIVLQHIKEGTLQASDIQDITHMYPNLYKQMASQLSSKMISHVSDNEPIPYKTRMSLSLFLGQALDSTMTPQAIQATQGTYKSMQAPQQQQPQGGGGGHKGGGSTSKLGKDIASYMTPAQAREASRAKND